MSERSIYRLLNLFNTAKATRRTISSGSPAPLARRAGRVAAGRATGRLFRMWR